jgi:hypothetical protein
MPPFQVKPTVFGDVVESSTSGAGRYAFGELEERSFRP